MEIMQVAAIYPKPNLSFPNKMNKAFPYLLRNVAITHVNQVWSTDITYIRFKNGFAYLTAVIDKFGCPTRLSMDSKGRAYDNIFVERFWRTLKQEDIYLKGYETVTECRQGLEAYLARYNDVRLHSSLDSLTGTRHRMYISKRFG